MKRLVSLFLCLALITINCGLALADTLEIDFWSALSGATGQALQDVVDAYNASQNDVTINVIFNGNYEDSFAKYQTTKKEDLPPLYLIAAEFAGFFMQNHYNVNIQKFVDAEDYDLSDIRGNLIAGYSDINGELMAIPWGNTVVGFYYDEDLMAKAGINPETDLESFKALAIAADELQAVGVQTPICFMRNNIWYTFSMTAEGHFIANNENGKLGEPTKSLISDEPVKSKTTKFFQIIKDMSSKGQLMSFSMSNGECREAFSKGECAILFATCSNTAYIGNLTEWQQHFGFHPAPTITAEAESTGTPVGGCCIFISDVGDEAKQQAAWDFLKFAMKGEYTADFAIRTGYLPINGAGAERPEYQEFLEKLPSLRKAMEAQANTKENCYNPFFGIQGDYGTIVIEILDSVINNPAYSAEQATDDLAMRVDEAMELYNMTIGN